MRKDKSLIITFLFTVILISAVGLCITLSSILLGGGISFSFHKPAKSAEPVESVSPVSSDPELRAPTENEMKYGVEIYTYEFTQDDRVRMAELGITEEDADRMDRDELLRRIKGYEWVIKNNGMRRISSMYKGAVEPSPVEREDIVEKLKGMYLSKDYTGILNYKDELLKKYTFVAIEDEEITSLIHDAEEMSTFEESDELLKQKIMANHYSIYTPLYDFWNFGYSSKYIDVVDSGSCIMLLKPAKIKLLEVYNKYDSTPPSIKFHASADLIYELEVTDSDGTTGIAYVESKEMQKQLIGIYYADGSCIAVGDVTRHKAE